MIKFEQGYDDFIQITRSQEFDGASGEYYLKVNFEAGHWKTEVENRLNQVENQLEQLIQLGLAEAQLRESNVTLKDAWDKYQVTLALVKREHDEAACNGGG